MERLANLLNERLIFMGRYIERRYIERRYIERRYIERRYIERRYNVFRFRFCLEEFLITLLIELIAYTFYQM